MTFLAWPRNIVRQWRLPAGLSIEIASPAHASRLDLRITLGILACTGQLGVEFLARIPKAGVNRPWLTVVEHWLNTHMVG